MATRRGTERSRTATSRSNWSCSSVLSDCSSSASSTLRFFMLKTVRWKNLPPSGLSEYWSSDTMLALRDARRVLTAATIPSRSWPCTMRDANSPRTLATDRLLRSGSVLVISSSVCEGGDPLSGGLQATEGVEVQSNVAVTCRVDPRSQFGDEPVRTGRSQQIGDREPVLAGGPQRWCPRQTAMRR